MIDSVCFFNDKKCVVWWFVGFFGVKLKKIKDVYSYVWIKIILMICIYFSTFSIFVNI